jgi:hypothetical protein
MRCDHVPRRLTSRSPVARWRARRHLAECPICGPDRAIIEGLADVPPLPDSHRALWLAAGRGAHPRPIRRDLALIAALLVIATTAALTAPLLMTNPGPPPRVADNPGPPAGPPILVELDGLRAALDPIDRELADLRRRADLLDARRDADRLLATYAWPESRS